MKPEPRQALLTVQPDTNGLLQVRLAGDWIARAPLPAIDPVEQQIAAGPCSIKAMEFETTSLGRWNSGLMTFVLKCYELCERNKIEFRSQTLPDGIAKLLQLSQAVPEKKDAAPAVARIPFFERLGVSALGACAGSVAILTFVGETLLAFVKLLRRKAQFRWADTLLVMQECGPKALGIVALINFSRWANPCVRRCRPTREIRRFDLYRRFSGGRDGA